MFALIIIRNKHYLLAKTLHRLLTVWQISRPKLALGHTEYIVDVARGVVVAELGTSFVYFRPNVADFRTKSRGTGLQRRSRRGSTLHRPPFPVPVYGRKPEVRLDYFVFEARPRRPILFVFFTAMNSSRRCGGSGIPEVGIRCVGVDDARSRRVAFPVTAPPSEQITDYTTTLLNRQRVTSIKAL